MAVFNDSHISPRRYKVDGLVAGRDGRTYVIGSIHTKARQVVLLGPLGETYVYQDDEFRNEVAAGELKLVVCQRNEHGVDEIFQPRELTGAEEKSRDERKQYIDIILEHIETGTWEFIYAEIQKKYSGNRKIPSRRTIERIWAIYKRSLSPNCLAANYSQRGVHRALSIDPLVEEVILNVIEEKYCNNYQFGIQDIVNDINKKCDDKSAELKIDLGGVSRRTVSRFIGKLNLKKIKGRLSRNSFRLIMRNALNYLDVKEPYARVEIDSTVLDIFIVDAFGNVIGCPTLYAMIDTATQTIVGIHLTIQAASQIGVLQTLQFAFSPKGEAFRQQYECLNTWPAPADVRTLVMDNGSDFHGPMVVKAAGFLSTFLEYCIAGAPYQKPFIERFFGTLHTMLINKLPGAKFSHDKREKHALENAQASAKLTLDELKKYIIRWVTDTYHIKKNDRLSSRYGFNCSPIEALNMLSQQYPIFPAPSPDEMMSACRHHLGIKLNVTREGVNYQKQQYQSAYVSALYKTNSKVKVDVCINPLDCSAIHIFDEDSKSWLVVPNKNTYMPAMSFEQAKYYRSQNYLSDHALSKESHVLNQLKIIEDANAKKSKKGGINSNRRAEREIEQALASITTAGQQSEPDVPQASPASLEVAAKPHRRKK